MDSENKRRKLVVAGAAATTVMTMMAVLVDEYMDERTEIPKEPDWSRDTGVTTLVKAHPKRRDYVNKPLSHNEDLKIICGDDHVTGEFSTDAFEVPQDSSVNLDSDDNLVADPVHVSSDDNGRPAKITSPPHRTKSKSIRASSGKSTTPSSSSMRKTHLSFGRASLVDAVKTIGVEMAKAIERSSTTHWSKELAEMIFAHDDLSRASLCRFNAKCLADEIMTGRLFMGLPPDCQRTMLMEFVKKDLEEHDDK